MVLAERVGRERSFWVGLVLTVVTVGVYAVYWNYKAPHEIYRQFELEEEDRDEGTLWYVLGLVLPPFLLAYLWIAAGNVAYVRKRMQLPQRLTPGVFLLLVALGATFFVVGAVMLNVAVLAAGEFDAEEQLPQSVLAALQVFLVFGAIAGALAALAYAMLQRDVNELWRAYDERMAQLIAVYSQPPPPLPETPPPEAPNEPLV